MSVGLYVVRFFGSEGRNAKVGKSETAGNPTRVYPFVVFEGKDIQDLHVKNPPPVPEDQLIDDPAIRN
eukprot:125339-Amorphochlora_amoeboformis.AAC.1